MIKSLSRFLILFMCPLFFSAFTSFAHAEDNFTSTNVFVTVGLGGGASIVNMSLLGAAGSESASQVCYDAEVGVIFLKYFGVVGGYAGCAADVIAVNRARLMLLLQKKMDTDSWGFRPYLAAGANYSSYDVAGLKSLGLGVSGFGFSTEAGLKFHYRMFLIGINFNFDTAFQNEDVLGFTLSKAGYTFTGGMKVGVVF